MHESLTCLGAGPETVWLLPKESGRRCRPDERVAGEEGFEPSNAGIKIRCLNQLGESPTIHALYQTIQRMLLQPLNQTALIFA